MKTLFTAAAAIGLIASPVAVARPAPSTNAARPLSVASAPRAAAATPRSARLATAGTSVAIVLIAASVIGALVLITDRDEPDSN